MTTKNIVQVTDQNFETTVGASTQLVLLDFWATWCAPCKMLNPLVEELALEYEGRVVIAELDVDANPITASKFGVLSIPSLILFRGGKPAERIVGYKPKAYLKQKIDAVLYPPPRTGVHGLRWAPRSSKPLVGILGDVDGRIVPVAPPPFQIRPAVLNTAVFTHNRRDE